MNKKLKLLSAVCFMAVLMANAQTIDFNWAAQIGGTSQEKSKSIAVDFSGNTYITGEFYGTMDFDPGTGVYNISADGPDLDIFISKLDSKGNFVWAKRVGGILSDQGMAIAVDIAGNVYATGWFRGTVDFDPGAGTFNLTNSGTSQGYNTYILKLNSNGNFVWAKQLSEGSPGVNGNAITVDTKCNVYTTGEFGGKVDFDPGTATQYLTASSDQDVFISKLDSSGKFTWAKQFSGLGIERGNGIDVDASGNVSITGEFTGTADFDPGSATYNLTANFCDVFIAKLDVSGKFLWAKSIGGSSIDQGFSIASDAMGNVYTTGLFFGTVDFDPGSGSFPATAFALNDLFVLKLDSSGNFVWAKTIGGASNDQGNSIKIDADNNLVIAGFFYATVDFDPGSKKYNVISVAKSDAFILELDSSGSFIWVKSIGGNLEDEGNSVALDTKGNVYVTGTFKQTANFYPNELYIYFTAFGNGNYPDIFVHKMSPPPCMESGSTVTITACNKYISPSGKYTWTSSNTYRDTITNFNGCDSVLTINLTIPVLDLSITKNNNKLTSNAANVNYQWIDCQNSNKPINGANSQTYTASVNGSYAVIISSGTCSDTSACIQLNVTGITENSFTYDFDIYPNPTNGIINVAFQKPTDNVSIEIYNSIGALVYQSSSINEINTINLSDQANGLYVIKIVGKNQMTTTRKVIKH